jgi:DNA-binding CsgD family transcriptional regulator
MTNEQSLNRQKEIANAIRNGITRKKIANAFGVSRSLVSQIAVRSGMKRFNCQPQIIKQDMGEIVQMVKSGCGYLATAKSFGISRKCVEKICRVRKMDFPSVSVELIKEIVDNHSFMHTSQMLGVPPSTIYSLAKRNGWTNQSITKYNTTNQRVIELLKTSMTQQEIAEQTGVSQSTVSLIAITNNLRRHNIHRFSS